MKKFTFCYTIILFLIVSFGQALAQENKSKIKSASELGAEVGKLLMEKHFEEALVVAKEAALTYPEDFTSRMNYGSILMMKGKDIFQGGDKKQGEVILKESERELLAAIKLEGTDGYTAPALSQCYFLLGEINYYAFDDKEKAKAYYKKSLEYYPEHGGSKEAIKLFQQ